MLLSDSVHTFNPWIGISVFSACIQFCVLLCHFQGSFKQQVSLAHARSYRDIATLAREVAECKHGSKLQLQLLAVAACFVDPSVSAEALIENDDMTIRKTTLLTVCHRDCKRR